MRGPVHEWADGLLPFDTFGNVIALEVIAAGEAEEGRTHGGQLLHQVNAIAVHAIVIGRWKQ